MTFSPTVPILIVGLIALLVYGTRQAARRLGLSTSTERPVYVLLGGLLLYAVAIGSVAYRGVLVEEAVLQYLPYLYLPFVPVVLVALTLVLSARVRESVKAVIRSAPLHWLIGFHAFRVSAVGTIFKLLSGQLPAHFIIPVGVPDFFVGVSAVVLARRIAREKYVPERVLHGWNHFGTLVFLPAPVLLHLSMPGPLLLLPGRPTSAEVFEFPMSLVPTFLVPLILMLHAAIFWKLRQPTQRDATAQPGR